MSDMDWPEQNVHPNPILMPINAYRRGELDYPNGLYRRSLILEDRRDIRDTGFIFPDRAEHIGFRSYATFAVIAGVIHADDVFAHLPTTRKTAQ